MANFQRESVTFDQALDFTRGSEATYFDSSGVLQTAAVNEPRFDHDPVTGEPLGLLIEEQRTNLFKSSEDYSTNWSLTESGATASITVSPNSGISPDGAQNADRVELSANTPDRAILRQAFNGLSGEHTVSFYIKSNTGAEYSIGIHINGTYYTTRTITDKWVRYHVTFPPASTAANIGIEINTSANTYADLLVWGAQLEQGSSPSSYIKTEGTQVTRAADNCSRALGAEFNASEGATKAVATVPVGETVIALGSDSIVSDSDTEKTYTLSYSADPSATTLDIAPGASVAAIKSLIYSPRSGA